MYDYEGNIFVLTENQVKPMSILTKCILLICMLCNLFSWKPITTETFIVNQDIETSADTEEVPTEEVTTEPDTDVLQTEDSATELDTDAIQTEDSTAESDTSPAEKSSIEIEVEGNDGIYTEAELADLYGTSSRYIEVSSFPADDLDRLSACESATESSDSYVIIQPLWESLEQELEDMLADYEGTWSIYLKDLSTGRTIEINDHTMKSASLIKLYIAGAVLEQIELGQLEETSTIDALLDAMITVSDNESANELVLKLADDDGDFQSGLDVVNDFIERYDFDNTTQVNGISDPNLRMSDDVNVTSTADCGHLLEMIYDKTLVSADDSERFFDLLRRQQVNYKIADALPDEAKIAHKTGEVSDAENDVSIISTPYGDFILCIMSDDLLDTKSAVSHIHEITHIIYNYFTGYVISGNPDEDILVEYLPEKMYIISETSGKNVELYEISNEAASGDEIIWEVYSED